jgi:hypothetical protein
MDPLAGINRKGVKLQMKKWSSIFVALLVALSLFTSTAYVNAQESGLTITKTPDKTSASLGDTITYTYVITNTSSGAINNLTLTDDKLGSVTLSSTSLISSENITATATHTVVVSDFPGPITNTATVSGTDGNSFTANASASVTLNPYEASLEIAKTADRASASPHEVITYTYTITNTGDVTINNLALNDSKLGAISLTSATLEPDQSLTVTATYTVTTSDLPGPITNTATVQGKDPAANTVSATSSSVSVSLTINKNLLTKSEVLRLSGVPGKGISKAPGLQKPFNPKSKAAEHAGKKK